MNHDPTAIQEHLKLQQEFKDYVSRHGFDYAEYCAPPPGSFYESYRKRWTQLTRLITPALHPEDAAPH